MSADPFGHSIVHVFLEEELGDRNPPDLSRAILSKAFGDETRPASVGRSGGRWAWPRRSLAATAAAAATVLIVATVWLTMPGGYPGPTISGDYQITSGDAVERGSTISTQDGSAVLELGGYCRVEILPWTTLRIDGDDYSEELFVEVGMAVCSVDSGVGGFSVLSELGSARVRGTKFTVRVEELDGRRQMRVQVAEGSVEVSDGSVRGIVQAGRERTITGGETKQPATAAATKPGDDIGVKIDLGDPGWNTESTSSSSDDGTGLREQIRAKRAMIEAMEGEIRELREENRRFREELDARPGAHENKERDLPERESNNPE